LTDSFNSHTMMEPENNKIPEPNNNADTERGVKRQKFWGIFNIILGTTGLAASIYSGFYDFKNIVPLFGTVIAGVLIGALSILIIIYGYRLFKSDL